jgi:putative endonuclease
MREADDPPSSTVEATSASYPQRTDPGYPQILKLPFRQRVRRATVADMTRLTNAVGAYGERVAMRTLALAGMAILDRNWRCAEGELDLVARHAHLIVFCEVKTRRGGRFGVPIEAVDRNKVRRLRAAAARWLAAHPRERGDLRFDVISVWPQRTGPPRVEHVMDAF